jgi:DNA (cytosine-5)-methyltransferase 3A
MNVLSLFDGMSCGRIALDKAGIPVTNYFASEIDKYAIQVAKANYPDTIHIGDVQQVMWPETFEGMKIDLLLGGSPCQGFSMAGKRLNFDDPRSKLFFEYVRILKECKPKYFLLENVRMKQESQDIISEYLGVQPVAINSSLLSAQNRYRLYWTNIPFDTPQDLGIKLQDILEDNFITDREKSHCIDANYFKGGGMSNLRVYFDKSRRQIVFSKDGLCHVGDADIKGHGYNKRVYHPEGKSPSLCAASGGNLEPKVMVNPASIVGRRLQDGVRKDNDKSVPITQCLEVHEHDKSRCLSTISKDTLISILSQGRYEDAYTKEMRPLWRKLTPLECERLQTVPDNYTNHVSNSQRYKMLGNGWTVDVIAHILKGVTT